MTKSKTVAKAEIGFTLLIWAMRVGRDACLKNEKLRKKVVSACDDIKAMFCE